MKFIENIEKESKIKLPICFIKNKALNKLEEYIEKRQIYALQHFYDDYEKNINQNVFKIINNDYIKYNLKLKNTDINIINNLIKIENNNINTIFSIISGIYYINNIISDLNKYKYTPTIKISLFLFIHINIIELINKILVYTVITKIKKENYNDKKYVKYFENGKFPELGRTIDMMKELKIIDPKFKEDNVFYKNKLIRNSIAHGNIFYDKQKRKIIVGSNEYKFNKFKRDLFYLYSFIKTWIEMYNKNSDNILQNPKKTFKAISNFFKRIGRSGIYKDKFNNIVFDFEKQ